MIRKKLYNNKKIFSISLCIILLVISTFSIQIHASSYKISFDKEENIFIFESDAWAAAEYMLYYHGKNNDYSIHSMQKVENKNENQILSYLFHLSPEGYILISPSYYCKPIIAYSFTSNAPMDTYDNPFYAMLSSDIILQLNQIMQLTEPLKQNYLSEWSTYCSNNYISNYQTTFEQWPPEGSTESGGWIETTWHQSEPYNDFCPIDPESKDRGIAGCPAIAMGQILNYHQNINNVQFNDSDDYYHNYQNRFWIDNDFETYDFPSFPQLNVYLTTLSEHYEQKVPITEEDKAALCFACGIAAKQVYSPQVSGTFGVDQAYDAFQRFKFDSALLFTRDSNELYAKIISNIKNALPVHFAVVTPAWNAGHNLIIDGYNTDDYYHLNFGWGGSYDGWYHIPSELPYDLTVIEGAIVDIHNISTQEDLECHGTVSIQDAIPGDVIYDSFTIENIGNSGSLLDWNIESVPTWGEWTIAPNLGNSLSPEEGPIIINISLSLPNQKNKEFTGSITIINTNNPSDRDYIPISVSTPMQKYSPLSERINRYNFPLFYYIINLLKNSTHL